MEKSLRKKTNWQVHCRLGGEEMELGRPKALPFVLLLQFSYRVVPYIRNNSIANIRQDLPKVQRTQFDP